MDWTEWKGSTASLNNICQEEHYATPDNRRLANYKLGENIWNRVNKSSKIGQDYKLLVSILAYFLTAIAKV